jgi:RNA 2',3'-cyclic 3'-phosphodiesterase
MRLFVALAVPDHVRDGLRAATAPLRERHPELRWTRPEGWHVTLAFLGQVPDEEVDGVLAEVRRAAGQGPAPTELRLDRPGRFGRSVLHVSVVDHPAGALTGLALAIRSCLVARGHPVDPQPIRGHLTLARAGRRGELTPGLLDAFGTGGLTGLAWRPSSVELWSSHLGDGPARYEVVASVALGEPST